MSIEGKATAPHSSTLAWKTPWTEQPGGLQSMGSLRVGHDWATSLSLFTFMHWRRKWQPTPAFFPGESQGQGSLVGCHLWGLTESDRLTWLSSSVSTESVRCDSLPPISLSTKAQCWCVQPTFLCPGTDTFSLTQARAPGAPAALRYSGYPCPTLGPLVILFCAVETWMVHFPPSMLVIYSNRKCGQGVARWWLCASRLDSQLFLYVCCSLLLLCCVFLPHWP